MAKRFKSETGDTISWKRACDNIKRSGLPSRNCCSRDEEGRKEGPAGDHRLPSCHGCQRPGGGIDSLLLDQPCADMSGCHGTRTLCRYRSRRRDLAAVVLGSGSYLGMHGHPVHADGKLLLRPRRAYGSQYGQKRPLWRMLTCQRRLPS